jgi:hypothetical protein
MSELKVGDIVGEFRYGHGVGEVVKVDAYNNVLVAWYEWSEADSWMPSELLTIEPYGGF